MQAHELRPESPLEAAPAAEKTPCQEKGFVHGPCAPEQEVTPEVDFTTFILGMGTSALFHLGAPLPSGERGDMNLPLAHNAIDTLAMLQLKTKGNLTVDEAQLLDTLLYDLRLRFVQAKRKAG